MTLAIFCTQKVFIFNIILFLIYFLFYIFSFCPPENENGVILSVCQSDPGRWDKRTLFAVFENGKVILAAWQVNKIRNQNSKID